VAELQTTQEDRIVNRVRQFLRELSRKQQSGELAINIRGGKFNGFGLKLSETPDDLT